MITNTTTTFFKSSKQPVIVMHLDYWYGHGDFGHFKDIAREILKIDPQVTIHAVIVKLQLDLAKTKKEAEDFIKSLPTNAQQKIYFYYLGSLEDKAEKISECEFNTFIDANPLLKQAYEQASQCFIISTPFPKIFCKYIAGDVSTITITEHRAPSFPCNLQISIPSKHHYVLGLNDHSSGLLVKDEHATDPATNLLNMPPTFLHKLGIPEQITKSKAQLLLDKTLFVPIYLGGHVVHFLRPMLTAIIHSPLAKQYATIVFLLNEESFAAFYAPLLKDKLPLNITTIYQGEQKTATMLTETNQQAMEPNVIFIVDHLSDADYTNFYKLSGGKGVAVCSGDKTLEMAISANLLPIYIAPPWKNTFSQDLQDFIFGDEDHYFLLSKSEGEEPNQFFLLLSNIPLDPRELNSIDRVQKLIADHITSNAFAAWQECRHRMIAHSFYPTLRQICASQTPEAGASAIDTSSPHPSQVQQPATIINVSP